MRHGSLIVAAAMMALAATDFVPTEGHKIGPGEKKSPARGVRLDVDRPKAKQKSSSLKKLLRK
jgi:hypothetical protein